MIAPEDFASVLLCGGFILVEVEISSEPLADAIGREAIARTRIQGSELRVTVCPNLSDKEFSVTLYHEILEAMTVAVAHPPASVMEFNEGDFERAGYEAFDQFGEASPASLNRMLQFFGFGEE
jgi:C-terminal processing protease CtpA/Prc